VENLLPISFGDGLKVGVENDLKIISNLQDFHWQASITQHSFKVKTIPDI
jgi:hypothetical protein